MSNQKIKKVIDALAEGSESVRNNPSEENYREQERNIENAGNSSNWTPYIIAGVVAIICICVFVVSSGGLAATQVTSSNASQIESIYVDHNVYENNLKGMRIHVKFTAVDRQNVNCRAVAYFFYETGDILKDYNDSYTTNNGQVSVGRDFTPQYYNTSFDDFTLFMPYDEFHTEVGVYDLKFKVHLYEKNTSDVFAISSYYTFQLTTK